jgi:hypothetical protein
VATTPSRPPILALGWDIVLNATIPLATYFLAKRVLAATEFTALVLATVFPTLKSGYDVIRHREVNPVTVLVLLGIVTSILAVFLGGDSRMLLIRESFFTGAFGIACLISLAFPRPLMFYFGRYFMAGKDAEKRRAFEGALANPEGRRAHRVVTTVWGLVYAGEFVARVILVYQASAAIVLAVSPIVMSAATIATITWTFSYAGRVRRQMSGQRGPASESATERV